MAPVREKKSAGRTPRTTIGLSRATKTRMDLARSPGQSYDGFIRQLMDSWDRARGQQEGSSQV